MRQLKAHQEVKESKTMSTISSLNLTKLEQIQVGIQNQVTFKLRLQDFNLMNGSQLLMISNSNGAKEFQEPSDII